MSYNNKMTKQIFFWSEKESFGFLSNFFSSPIELKGKVWPTVEHYYQAMKTLDEEAQEKIRLADTPLKSKRMGRKLALRADWEAVKYQVMKEGLVAKFTQQEFKEKLKSTGDSDLFEDSPFDQIWGTGKKNSVGTGLNLLGKALMEVRGEI
jgi:ribA/ribD-fused uncharacterized protein